MPRHPGRWRRARSATGRARAGEADDRASADLVILNTCTVTANADDDARSTIRRVHRENPAAKILVTGCYAQRAPEELAAMPGVEWVVGNSHKTQIADLIAGKLDYHGQILTGDIFETRDILTAPILDSTGDRTRPNLKIQDGCHNRCSFCIIPFVRGKSRFVAADQVVAQVRSLADTLSRSGLSGINLGRWGREAGQRACAWPISLAPPAGRNGNRAHPAEFRRADGLLR